MFDRNAHPSSNDFIDALNDDMYTARSLLRLIVDLIGEVEDADDRDRSAPVKTIELEIAPLRRSLTHVDEMMESVDERAQKLWDCARSANQKLITLETKTSLKGPE